MPVSRSRGDHEPGLHVKNWLFSDQATNSDLPRGFHVPKTVQADDAHVSPTS